MIDESLLLTDVFSKTDTRGHQVFEDIEGSDIESGESEDTTDSEAELEEEDDEKESEALDTEDSVYNFLFRSKTKDGTLIPLVGKSERGKTVFLKWLLANAIADPVYPTEYGLIFLNVKFNKRNYDWLPHKRIKYKFVYGFDQRVLVQFIKNLEKMEEEGTLKPSFIIFEDLVGVFQNNSNWFVNFMGTFRHFQVRVYMTTQYLSGKNSVSTIMREQTTSAVLFNSRFHNTLDSLYEAFGGLFEDFDQFKEYYVKNTSASRVGPYVAMIYKESQDELADNYHLVRCPIELPNYDDVPEKPKPKKKRKDHPLERVTRPRKRRKLNTRSSN